MRKTFFNGAQNEAFDKRGRTSFTVLLFSRALITVRTILAILYETLLCTITRAKHTLLSREECVAVARAVGGSCCTNQNRSKIIDQISLIIHPPS